jgi:hypothetical protein
MLRNLHLRTCSLWPRFHVTISESLEIKKPEVIELNIPLSDSMLQIQTSILQCIEASLSELKKGNSKELDMAEWNVDSALHKNFDSIVRRQLDPVWHRVSSKTRGIVGDLKELREMLGYLLSYDAVSLFLFHSAHHYSLSTPAIPGLEGRRDIRMLTHLSTGIILAIPRRSSRLSIHRSLRANQILPIPLAIPRRSPSNLLHRQVTSLHRCPPH